ncbi:MAG: phosphoenolpyruvate synthase [Bacteroidales bacterium]|nr:phosphoenolpyruvate synthase [Bacteroidales bacterium]
MNYIYKFQDLDNSKVAEVGGKNASLGEMFTSLESKGVRVPDGFATSADCYRDFLEANDLEKPIRELLDKLDPEKMDSLEETGSGIRKKIMEADIPDKIGEAIIEGYIELKDREKEVSSVAVRSSATAEDLPETSFAGQHDSFMNIKGEEALLNAWKKCVASLFTDRAIKYREENGFEHMKVALSVGVQKMVRADQASSGVAFTIDPDSGFENVVLVNGTWGLGENVVQGTVRSDEFYLYKKALKEDKRSILTKRIGSKKKMMVFSDDADDPVKNIDTPEEKRSQQVLTDEALIGLGKWCLAIEEHYDKPMDIEWAVDGETGEMFIVQARPETVHSSKEDKAKLKTYSFDDKGESPVLEGIGIGNKIVSGKVKILDSPDDAGKLEEGEVLVTEITNPDWDPVMKKASAIVTKSGGRTSHAAIVARELGAVAIVGTGNATETLEDGQEVTVSSAGGTEGKIFDGTREWNEEEIDTSEMEDPDTKVMLILAHPGTAFNNAQYPVDGVGLMRLEFVINSEIMIHPMALLKFDELEDKEAKKEIEKLTSRYDDKKEYFTDKLSMAVGTIAAAFYPREVIVRMSDFKSNEYSELIGGKQFEPEEENPMVGFRGAARYYHEGYREGFALECEAMRIVRDEMGLTNVKLMIPFCRTFDEGKKVIEEMEKNGLKRGENDLEIYVMTELPVNAIRTEAFSKIFDGFSIGSNDLTQLVLGVDRDSELVSHIFSEQDPAVMEMIEMSIRIARENYKEIGLCGQAPSDFPKFAKFLVENKINSISFNPDAVASGIRNIVEAEKNLKT